MEASLAGQGSPVVQEVHPRVDRAVAFSLLPVPSDLHGVLREAFSGVLLGCLTLGGARSSFLVSTWAREGQGRGPSCMGPVLVLLLLLLLLTSPHLTSPHLTSPHLTSPHPAFPECFCAAAVPLHMLMVLRDLLPHDGSALWIRPICRHVQ